MNVPNLFDKDGEEESIDEDIIGDTINLFDPPSKETTITPLPRSALQITTEIDLNNDDQVVT